MCTKNTHKYVCIVLHCSLVDSSSTPSYPARAFVCVRACANVYVFERTWLPLLIVVSLFRNCENDLKAVK